MAPKRVTPSITVGDRFGLLTVVAKGPVVSRFINKKNQRWVHTPYWKCRCDCGTIKDIAAKHLRNGPTRACGCQRHKPAWNRSHNMKGSSEYEIWCSMRDRCRNPNNPNYFRYGGRGIFICQEWDDFAVFYREMGPRPSPEHSVDRRDNDGPYSKENCRWATDSQQQRNTRRNVYYEYGGRSLTAIELSEISGVPYKTLHQRLRQGWPMSRALNPTHGNATR